MARKFFKTVIQIEVLSEDEAPRVCRGEDISSILYEMSEGSYSGEFRTVESKELTGKECAAALLSQGSDPAFFSLDDEGNEIDE